MSYIFRLHKGSQIEAAGDGWLNSAPIDANAINQIEDSLDKMEDAGKVGTSIPTPFARIYLFKTAFDMVNRNAKGVYAELVSDCLDLLQFLFENGGSNQLEFVVWDKKTRVEKLTGSQNALMRLLGDALNSAYTSNTVLPNQFVLIKYKGKLLGGTSPFTLVFTSPNLRRIIKKEQNLSFTSTKNVEFCGTTNRSLRERPVEFQNYLLGLMIKHRETIDAESPMASFRDYVFAQVPKDDDAASLISEQFDRYNKPYNLLSINGINIYYNVKAPEMSGSDFLMKVSANAPCYTDNYVPTTPLFLLSKFDAGSNWTYIDDNWNRDTVIQNALVRDTPIRERHLPKNGSGNGEYMPQKYPWLTDSDFLYDEIVCTDYKLNTDKFYIKVTNNDPNKQVQLDAHFLLPVRKEYFLYFTMEDLKRDLRIRIVEGEAKKPRKIEVELDIPLSSKRDKITIRRTYTKEETAEYKIKEFAGDSFSLGIFPFYQLTDPNLKDQYNVYLFNNNGHDALKFYSQKHTDSNGFEEVEATSIIRSKTKAGQSRIYTLRSESVSKSFDYIEASIKDAKGTYQGLIIPIWPEVSTNNEEKKAIFSIDFGTSNTHIAYYDTTSQNDNPRILPFSIENDCQQMVLLNAPITKDKKQYWRDAEGFSGIDAMPEFLREFAPSVIGDNDYDNNIKYPIRTATLQAEDLNNCSDRKADDGEGIFETEKNRLFEAINIGFNIDSETSKIDKGFTYKTNLKWALQENRSDKNAQLRVEAFCEQTLWMLKNMLVLKGMYSQGIQIIYYYPESMLNDDKEMFEKAWKKAIANVFTRCGFGVEALHQELESVAPYYSLMKQTGDLFAYNSVNIDIGGGTTDIFLFDKDYTDPETGSQYYGYETSVQFAGNDLWGKAFNSSQVNGFVEYQKSTKDKWDKNLQDIYQNFSRRDDPEDLASFFFKYGGFKFSDNIKNHSKLRFVLFLHYAAIIYYLSDMIKQIRKDRPELKMPQCLTFTGKGSEYIKIITPNEEIISTLTWELFKVFGLDPSDRFEVRYPKNPKALTAEGGIYKLTGDKAIKVDFVKERASSRRSLDSSDARKVSRYRNMNKELLGFTPEEGKVYKIAQIRQYDSLVMKRIEEYVDAIFNSEEICEILKEHKIILDKNKDRDLIIDCAKKSFDQWGEKYKREHEIGEDIEGTIFFLAWKNTLIDLSVHYYNTTQTK